MRGIFAWAVAVVVGAVACTSSAPATSSGGGVACSTGAAYAEDTAFPYLGSGGGDAPAACTPRCGYASGTEPPGFYYVDALPSGACEREGDSCTMGVRIRCCQKSVAGPAHSMRCTCRGGAWSCGIASQGAGTCGSGPCSDASSEAGGL